MNDIEDLCKALLKTGDGVSVFLWVLIFAALFVGSIASSGPTLNQLKYLFFSLIAFLIFSRFRVSRFRPNSKTSMWGLINVNAFGLFIVSMEFFK